MKLKAILMVFVILALVIFYSLKGLVRLVSLIAGYHGSTATHKGQTQGA
jgi:hypothetical protein